MIFWCLVSVVCFVCVESASIQHCPDTSCLDCISSTNCIFIVTRTFEKKCIYKSNFKQHKVKSVFNNADRCQEVQRYEDMPMRSMGRQDDRFTTPPFQLIPTTAAPVLHISQLQLPTISHSFATTPIPFPKPISTTLPPTPPATTPTTPTPFITETTNNSLALPATSTTAIIITSTTPTTQSTTDDGYTTVPTASTLLTLHATNAPVSSTRPPEKITISILPSSVSPLNEDNIKTTTHSSTVISETPLFIMELQQSLAMETQNFCKEGKNGILRVARGLCWASKLVANYRSTDIDLQSRMSQNPMQGRYNSICKFLMHKRALCKELNSL